MDAGEWSTAAGARRAVSGAAADRVVSGGDTTSLGELPGRAVAD